MTQQKAHGIVVGAFVGILALGIVAGCVAGAVLASFQGPAALRFATVLSCCVGGFALGLWAAYGASAAVFRFAYETEARALPEWPSLPIQAYSDERFPHLGKNAFVVGVPFAGLRPLVFVAESVLRGCTADERAAILAHESAHLAAGDIQKRLRSGIGTFLSAAFFSALCVAGLSMMGFMETAIQVGAVSGVIPVCIVWISQKRMLERQEIEADRRAVREFGVAPESLYAALAKLSRWNDGRVAPIVQRRMEILRFQCRNAPAAPFGRRTAA